jgi:transcription elongation GreA/GreB family factor
MIKQLGSGKFQLMTSDGSRPLSKHPQTLEEAKAQEAAINISKARAAGHRIPGSEWVAAAKRMRSRSE